MPCVLLTGLDREPLLADPHNLPMSVTPRLLLTGHDGSSIAGVPVTLCWLHPVLRMATDYPCGRFAAPAAADCR